MPLVSVIMPTFNKARYLALTLAGFTKQTMKDFEVVIVDDGCSDNTRSIAESYSDRLDIVYITQQNMGRSVARNAALEHAEGEIIVFNDDDRIPVPGFLQAHVEALRADPRAVSIGLKNEIVSVFSPLLSKNAESEFLLFLQRNPGLLEAAVEAPEVQVLTEADVLGDFRAHARRCFFRVGYDQYTDVILEYGPGLEGFRAKWSLVTTGNLAHRRTEDVRFDLGYTGWGLEDTDYGYQLQQQGWNLICTEQALNFHQMHPRSASTLNEFLRNMDYFQTKHGAAGPFSEQTLEVGLYSRVHQKELTLIQMNQILMAIEHLPDGVLRRDYMRLVEAHAAVTV